MHAFKSVRESYLASSLARERERKRVTGSEWIRLCVFGGVVGCGGGVCCVSVCIRGVCERRLTDAFFHSFWVFGFVRALVSVRWCVRARARGRISCEHAFS